LVGDPALLPPAGLEALGPTLAEEGPLCPWGSALVAGPGPEAEAAEPEPVPVPVPLLLLRFLALEGATSSQSSS
jgi:hypothetical protein